MKKQEAGHTYMAYGSWEFMVTPAIQSLYLT